MSGGSERARPVCRLRMEPHTGSPMVRKSPETCSGPGLCARRSYRSHQTLAPRTDALRVSWIRRVVAPDNSLSHRAVSRTRACVITRVSCDPSHRRPHSHRTSGRSGHRSVRVCARSRGADSHQRARAGGSRSHSGRTSWKPLRMVSRDKAHQPKPFSQASLRVGAPRSPAHSPFGLPVHMDWSDLASLRCPG